MENNKNIPKHWEIGKLGEVCDIQTGKYDANHAKPNGKYRFYTCAFESVYCDTNRFKGESLILPGNGANVGEVFYYNGEFDAYQRTYVLNKIKTLPKYLYYHLLGNWKRRNQDKQFGSATNYIRMANFTDYVVPIPPLSEQEAIVAKIEELFSELDKGIEQLKTAQQQLKIYRQSVLKWAFEGKLTEEWRLNYDACDLVDKQDLTLAAETSSTYKTKNNQGNQTNPINQGSDNGELPEGWKWATIEEVAKVGTGATPLKSNNLYYNGKIAWVTSGALNEEFVTEATDFVTEKAIRETNLSVYPKHTLLVAMYGEGKTRGKCSELLIEACTNQAIAAIYFDKNNDSIKPYLKYCLLKNYNDVRKQSSGGVQPNLNLGIIKKLRFPLSPPEEQNQIVQEIESRLSVADKMEESITQSLQQAEALRQSILKKAFEGRLV